MSEVMASEVNVSAIVGIGVEVVVVVELLPLLEGAGLGVLGLLGTMCQWAPFLSGIEV